MKTPLCSVVALVAFGLLVPSARADDHPRGWLGLMLGDPAQSSPEMTGVLVRGVVEGGPADEGRIRAKDSIVAIDGTSVNGATELMARVRDLAPGSFVTLSVNRGGHDLELRTVLGRRPEGARLPKMVRGRLGVDAIELPASLRAHFGAPEDAGVLVSNVIEGSPADDAGIRVGDVIYEADGQPVSSAGALSEFVNEAGVDNSIDVVLARDGARIVVEPQIERAP